MCAGDWEAAVIGRCQSAAAADWRRGHRSAPSPWPCWPAASIHPAKNERRTSRMHAASEWASERAPRSKCGCTPASAQRAINKPAWVDNKHLLGSFPSASVDDAAQKLVFEFLCVMKLLLLLLHVGLLLPPLMVLRDDLWGCCCWCQRVDNSATWLVVVLCLAFSESPRDHHLSTRLLLVWHMQEFCSLGHWAPNLYWCSFYMMDLYAQ